MAWVQLHGVVRTVELFDSLRSKLRLLFQALEVGDSVLGKGHAVDWRNGRGIWEAGEEACIDGNGLIVGCEEVLDNVCELNISSRWLWHDRTLVACAGQRGSIES